MTSIGGKRIRKRDSRELAYEFIMDNVPHVLLEDKRLADAIEVSGPSPLGHGGAIVARAPDGFRVLESVLHEGGFTGLRFKRREGALDFYVQ